jgi:hypothetical protein
MSGIYGESGTPIFCKQEISGREYKGRYILGRVKEIEPADNGAASVKECDMKKLRPAS